jgi:2,4-dienoyl-CoA reductase-like NADH-dependent reductase (Old Yellow Enzyme family)
MSHEALFSPFQIKGLALPNRVVMAPMTRSFSPGGVPTGDVAAYYRRRAEGGVGLIVTEGTGIDRPASLNDANIPRFHGEALAGWKKVVDEVHAAGGRIAPQLWHVGSVKGKAATTAGRIDSPSGLNKPGERVGEPMSEGDIADTIAAFARAAADAERLGFDAVELHGAHGYLIDQFFWDATNKRADSYGGRTLPERARFAAEILKAVRAAVGADFPVILRLSQWKGQDFSVKLAADPKELEAWVAPLAEAGADVFHCSQRRFWEAEFEGSGLNFAGWVKKLTGKPTITVGSVGLDGDLLGAFQGKSSQAQSLDALLERLDRGEFDLVAVGRALLNDPQWLRKIKDGRAQELRGFDPKSLATLY